MGWGKAKGKGVERALHQAEHQEERAAHRALAHGDFVGAVVHSQNAEALKSVEHDAHWKGHWKGQGKGKGYHGAPEVILAPAPPQPVVVAASISAPVDVALAVPAAVVVTPQGKGKAVERALHREELCEEVSASAALAHGDVVGAAIHAERAQGLRSAERAVHHDNVHAEARHAHHVQMREERLAARDLAHGNILGALAHEVRAEKAHRREDRFEAELFHDRWEHHDHWDHHHHKGWGKAKGKGKGWW